MKNPATNCTRDDFNRFTQFLYNEIKEGRKPSVKLRDGRVVTINWFDKDGPEYEHFIHTNESEHVYLIWENDGHSVTSTDFDMMEIV